MNTRHSYQTNRYTPGTWNGLNGWTHCAQYFNTESKDRVSALLEITELLRKNRVCFEATIWKKYCRVKISYRDYRSMPEKLTGAIQRINADHCGEW